MAEIARHTLEGEFRRIDPGSAEVLLIEGGPRVLQAMPEIAEPARAGAVAEARRPGAPQRARSRPSTPTGLHVESPFSDGGAGTGSHRIACHCVIWAAGVAASPLGRLLAAATGAETDRAGRVKVAARPEPAGPSGDQRGRRPRGRHEPPAGQGAEAGARRLARRQADGPRRGRQHPAPHRGPADSALPLPRLRQPRDHRPQLGGGRPRHAASGRCASRAGWPGCSGCSRTSTS